MSVTENRYLAGNFGPVTEEVTAFDLEVTGTLPPELDGRLLRNGPNPRGDVDPAMHHWFVGAGMVHGVRLRDGRADWYRNRFVGGDGMGDDGTAGGPNTNVIGHAGKTWALVEHGTLPVELTDELESVGTNGFEGTLTDGYTAHPHRHPGTGELHGVSYHWSWDHVRYTIVGTDGRVRREVHVPVPGHPMVHDCAITEDHLLLFDLPCTFDIEAAMEGHKLPFRWHPEEGARVGVLPHDGEADDVTWHEVEPCYVFHPLNAFAEADGRLVVDVVRHPKMFAADVLGPNEGSTRLDRWTIDTTVGAVKEETLDDHSVELPRHDERRTGQAYRYGYAMEVGGGFTHSGLVKWDLATGATQRHDVGDGRFALEPVFVPRSDDAGEDEGWVLSYVYDAATDRSDVVVLAADDFTAEPVATVHLPQRVPFGFHGNWVPTP
jgi:carotenoid cleavage dioxygenase-like enzyme